MSAAPGFLHSIWANSLERGYLAWSDWQSSITRAYQTPVCNYEGSIWWWDLICARITVTKMYPERGTDLRCDHSIIFICMSSPANIQAALTDSLLFCQFFPGWIVSGYCSISLLIWNLIFTFDIWFTVCCLYSTFGCESQKFKAWVVRKQQVRGGCSQKRHRGKNKIITCGTANIKQWPILCCSVIWTTGIGHFPLHCFGWQHKLVPPFNENYVLKCLWLVWRYCGVGFKAAASSPHTTTVCVCCIWNLELNVFPTMLKSRKTDNSIYSNSTFF